MIAIAIISVSAQVQMLVVSMMHYLSRSIQKIFDRERLKLITKLQYSRNDFIV